MRGSGSSRPPRRPNATATAKGAVDVALALERLREEPRSRFAAVAALGSVQHGLVAYEQLVELGWRSGEIARLCRRGLMHRVRFRVYAVGHLALGPQAHQLAAAMTMGPTARIAGPSAVLAHEIAAPWHVPDLFPIHVMLPGRRRRPRPDVLPRRGVLTEEDCCHIGPLPATNVQRTLIDVAAEFKPRVLERCVDQALVDGKTTTVAIRSALARHPGRRGVGILGGVLDVADRFAGLTRSELEAELASLTRAARYPKPRFNHQVPTVQGRFDAFWPAERVGVEVDGWRWHRTGTRQHADRVKELDARRAGILLLRYSARQVFNEQLTVVADLGRALVERRG